MMVSREKVINGLRQSFFWYDTDFSKKSKSKKSVSYQETRAHPSFGMTPTQVIRDLFAWGRPDDGLHFSSKAGNL